MQRSPDAGTHPTITYAIPVLSKRLAKNQPRTDIPFSISVPILSRMGGFPNRIPRHPRRPPPPPQPTTSIKKKPSPVGPVHEPPSPLQHHASPSPLPVGASHPSSPLHVIPSTHPTSSVEAVREPPFHLQHHASPSPLPVAVVPRGRPSHLTVRPTFPIGTSLVEAIPRHTLPPAW